MSLLAEPVAARELTGVGGVRVWSIDLSLPAPEVAAMLGLLSTGERERAARYGGDPARRRFVVARASLRTLLAEAMGAPASRVIIETGRDGKPFLKPTGGQPVPEFNLSHARDLALVAIGGPAPVGIDVEWVGGTTPIEGVIRRFFSDPERQRLAQAAPAGRRELFHRIWVRKEAYLKGRGEGISEWIHRTDFSEVPDGHDLAWDPSAWLVRDLAGLPAGFVASVAVRCP